MKTHPMFSVLALGMTILASPVMAGEKLLGTFTFNTFCGFNCPIDSFKRATLKMQPSDEDGANGVAFKFVMSGASLGGVPANRPNVVVVLSLSTNGGPCNIYEASIPDGIVEGRAKVALTGADLNPPLAESPGSVLLACNQSYIQDYDLGNVLAFLGISLGTDSD